MYISKPYFLAVAMMAVMSGNGSFAQSNVKRDSVSRRKPYIVLHLGGGISTYSAPVNIRRPIDLPGSISRLSGAATIRLMWYPKYRLRVGLESGFTNFYSYKVKNGNTPGRVSLNAIPLLVVWSMQVAKRVNIYAGFGSYLLTTHLDYNGEVNSSAFVLGSNIALSYTLPLSTRAGIAAEAKWMNAFETKDAAISLQTQLIWKFAKL
jgi:hypothetical protein